MHVRISLLYTLYATIFRPQMLIGHPQGRELPRIDVSQFSTLWSDETETSIHPSLDNDLLHMEMRGLLPRQERCRILWFVGSDNPLEMATHVVVQ
jgi:hypothetical protein